MTKPPRNQSCAKQNLHLRSLHMFSIVRGRLKLIELRKSDFREQRDAVLSHSFMAKSGTNKTFYCPFHKILKLAENKLYART